MNYVFLKTKLKNYKQVIHQLQSIENKNEHNARNKAFFYCSAR